jgi:uncharacterized protein YndB with AHSA1/START domain/predicted enzyme related to lactoylglutathione lyase
MSQSPTVPDTRLVLRRTYEASRERLFAAWTTPETLRQFFGPGDTSVIEAELDVRERGRYRITFRRPDGEQLTVGGVYREIRAPERIVCSWAWEEDDPALEKETLLTLEFFDRGDATELILTHEDFRDATQRDNHERGWTPMLDQLADVLRPIDITGMDLSGYMVKDGARAIAFYRDVLGLEPSRVYSENRGAEYDLPDGATFGLWGGGNKVFPFQPSNGVLLAVGDFDAAVATLKKRGIPVVELDLPNCAMAGVTDTEGNTIFLHKRKDATSG